MKPTVSARRSGKTFAQLKVLEAFVNDVIAIAEQARARGGVIDPKSILDLTRSR